MDPDKLTKQELQKLADNLQLQSASFQVTLSEPPTHIGEVPGFMQPLIDTVLVINRALQESGSTVLGMRAVRFTPSVIAPESGRGDLHIEVYRAKTPTPALHGKN